LQRFGERVATDILALGDAAEAAPPRHVPFDPWGRRVDRIETSEGWRTLDRISAEEGLVAIGYERANGALSRIDQFARLYLFSPSSATYSCPLAMSDGAARCLELYGTTPRLREALRHLTTRNPDAFWTSGQWMTEKTGGSDVSGTSTIACRDGECFRLRGVKWFTSATTSQMAMTLARIEGAPAGSHGLSLFHLELRDADGQMNDIRVLRLKDKLGTRALPTAEVLLEGTRAWLVGEEGQGVRTIASLFTVTRVYNAVAAVAGMRRALALARDYAGRRVAFGRLLAAQPLHVETLADMAVEVEAGFHLAFRVVELLGATECGTATARDAALLRVLTPVAKLFTGKQAVAVASEALEAFGGAGYIEDTGLPRLLRDAQVLSIWEGTTNVLSLDVLRALDTSDALRALVADARDQLARLTAPELAASAARASDALEQLERSAADGVREGSEFREATARAFAYAAARAYAAALMLVHADWSLAHEGDRRATIAATRWCARPLVSPMPADAAYRNAAHELALDEATPDATVGSRER
jgi:alkylation response protein AidB-like acyl-CoA dehydrogenase